MISIREYALNHGCTVQNIYKHIKANQEALEGHIHKRGSKKFLDDFAQNYLETLITPKNIIVQADEKAIQEINKLRAEIVALNQKIANLSEEKSNLYQELADFRQNQPLLENKNQELEKEKNEYKEKFEEAKNEADSYQKTIFGFYRKKTRA